MATKKAAASPKNEAPEVKRGDLVNAAKELNDVIELDPAINVKAKPEELTEKLLEAATLLDLEDEISAETTATLTAIGAKLPAKPAKAAAKEKKATPKKAAPKGKVTKAELPDREALVEIAEALNALDGMVAIDLELEDDELVAAIKEAAGTLEEADFELLQFAGASATLVALGIGRPGKKVAQKGKAKADKPKKEKAEPKAKGRKAATGYTRSHALVDALKENSGKTRDQIVEAADKLFTKNGGKANLNVSNYMFGYVMPTLLILGIVKQDGKAFTWTSK